MFAFSSTPSLSNGSFAVAVVKNQVMVVQAARSHTKRDKYVEVKTFMPFGEGIFLASDVPSARIASSDILKVLPPLEDRLLNQGMLELPKKAFSQYIELNSRHQKRYEDLWNSWVSKN
ncbi:hypothetical protein NLJ89_g9246 [Agrocybe chaxingu]|uniref:Uncharacterized protein n=1 Tax=Agrocybe chaxingu TaxID=84603 RepID=A0A9W8MTA7_9AGAR|nr:hypothetical protein NLJ89_g9246 [Agrocybe chaxingu]